MSVVKQLYMGKATGQHLLINQIGITLLSSDWHVGVNEGMCLLYKCLHSESGYNPGYMKRGLSNLLYKNPNSM